MKAGNSQSYDVRNKSIILILLLVIISCIYFAEEITMIRGLRDKSDISDGLRYREEGVEEQKPVLEQSHPESKCLSFDDGLDQLLNSTKQVFIGMPAKAAGTSLNHFARYCMKGFNVTTGNPLANKNDLLNMTKINYEFPPVVSSHLIGNEKPLDELITGATSDTLIIYVHRRETDRLLSAIKHVAKLLCRNHPRFQKQESFLSRTHQVNDSCVLEESVLYDLISSGFGEIDMGIQKSIPCSFFDNIQKHKKAKLAIMNFAQVDRLQKSIAKRHCPELLEGDTLPVHENDDHPYIGVALMSDKRRVVRIEEWVNNKKHVLEILFDRYKGYHCDGKVTQMEEELFDCEDEVLRFSG